MANSQPNTKIPIPLKNGFKTKSAVRKSRTALLLSNPAGSRLFGLVFLLDQGTT